MSAINSNYVPIDDVKKNPHNPRIIKDDKFKKLVQSIKDFPEMLNIRPIVCNVDMIVLGGNMRLAACKGAGLKEVPVIIADNLTEEQQREFIIKDNVSGGEWDWDVLANEWNAEELDAWGLDVPEMEQQPEEGLTDENAVPEVPAEPVTHIGDIWTLGNHRLMCGDSASVTDAESLMCGDMADMVFTDPPYGVSYKGKTKDALEIKNDSSTPDELRDMVSAWFGVVDAVSRAGAYMLATVPPGALHLIFAQDWLDRGWLRQILVWNKSKMVFGHSEYHYKHELILFGWKEGGERLKCKDRTKTSVWDFRKPQANREHPTVKPVEMWEYGITNHTKSGDILYEPFGGSGTCMIACEKLGRKSRLMEIDPKYCDVIVKRWREFTGKEAVLSDGRTFSEVSNA